MRPCALRSVLSCVQCSAALSAASGNQQAQRGACALRPASSAASLPCARCVPLPTCHPSPPFCCRYKDAFVDYIKEVVLPSLKKHHDEHLLRQLKLRWDNHKVGKQAIGRGQAWRRKRQGRCPRCGRVHGIARRTSLVCAWTTAWCALEAGCDTCALPATEHGSHQAAAPSCSLSQLRHRVHSGHGIPLPRRSWFAGCRASSTTSTATTSR